MFASIPTLSGPALFDAGIRSLGVVFILFSVALTSGWLTVLTAPRPVANLPSKPIAPQENSLKLVSRLFGVGEARPQIDEALQLVGVFANSKGGGFATFNTRNGAISVFAGNEIVPGVRLKQIERDRVIILSAGAQKELRLSQGGGQQSPPIGQTPAPSQQATPSIPQSVETNQQASSNRRAARPLEEEQ